MRLSEDLLTLRVRAALGSAYDPKADYRIVRPDMVGLPKFAADEVVGEFAEDTREGTRVVILRRAAPKPPPPVSAAERVRAALGARKPTAK